MSYDLAVYAPRAPSYTELHSLIRECAGLDVGSSAEQSFEVVRGVGRRYCFSVDGPERLEPEDVPAEVARVVLNSRCVVSVVVEGSTQTEIPHAIRFARRLAQALDGAVLDQQADELWSRSRSRVIAKPARQARVAAVDLVWNCRRDDLTHDPASLYLDTVSRHLPEALPRRFGEYEPLQGKFANAGNDGFISTWAEASSRLLFSGSGPCIGGSIAPGPGERYSGPFWSMSLTLLAEPLTNSGWRSSVRRAFTALADGLPCFYASATVTRGHIWSGRSLWSDGSTEWGVRPLRFREGWMGLSPVPAWWIWFGRPYADLTHLLPSAQTSRSAEGVLFESAVEPTAADKLEPLQQWLPSDRFAKLGPNPNRQQPVPLLRAELVPDSLISRS